MYAKFNRPDPQRDWDWLRPHTLNLYEYVANDPINKWDPDGLQTMVLEMGFIPATSEAVATLSATVSGPLVLVPVLIGGSAYYMWEGTPPSVRANNWNTPSNRAADYHSNRIMDGPKNSKNATAQNARDSKSQTNQNPHGPNRKPPKKDQRKDERNNRSDKKIVEGSTQNKDKDILPETPETPTRAEKLDTSDKDLHFIKDLERAKEAGKPSGKISWWKMILWGIGAGSQTDETPQNNK